MSMLNPSTDKCLWTAKILRTNPNDYQCIPCFINEALRHNTEPQVTITNFLIKHCFARGPYESHHCNKCSRNITKEKPINECSICTEKCTELLAKMTSQGIRVSDAQFMYDVYNDEVVYFHVTPQATTRNV